MISETEVPPLPPGERRAAWWSWPVILLSVFFIGWSVNLFSPEAGPPVSPTAPREGKALAPSQLALMKLEAQIVIGSAAAGPAQVAKSLESVRKQVRGDEMAAAYVMLVDFVAGGDEDRRPDRETFDELFSEDSGSIRELAEKAVRTGLTAAERSSFENRVGWFASLPRDAATGEVPDRGEIMTRAMLVMAMVGGVFSLALIAIVSGAVLLFLFLRKQRLGEPVTRFDPRMKPRGVLLEAFAIYLGTMAVGELLGVLGWVALPAVTYLFSLVLPFLWPLVRGVSWRDFRYAMGCHRGRGIFREIGAGVVGYAAVLAIASIGIFLTIVLIFVVDQIQVFRAEGAAGGGVSGGPPSSGPVTHPIIGWIYTGGWKERAAALFLAAGIAPLFEEIFFRGALHRYLRGRFGFLVAALLTGILFAALHPQGWMGIPALAAIGVGFSLLREWRDSLIAPMIAHAINNGVLVGLFCFAL